MHTERGNPHGATAQLCAWIDRVQYSDIPPEVLDRAKYIILDGIACAIVGAHLPWSETAAGIVKDMESAGPCQVFGHEMRLGALAAAILNSTFIQGFELDDYHSEAPLHSNAIILPAVLAAAELMKSKAKTVSGSSLLLATIVGYEVGPRVGLSLHGTHMLSRGWHSGAVFGPSASAAAVGKLLDLDATALEDALGTACTQACGLMSAQFGSMAKRMQHGFASRNGLFAALLAQDGYTGIHSVFEQPYGGFLQAFSAGTTRDPPYLVDELTKLLGQRWQTQSINVKPYASMAATHGVIDSIVALQSQYPERFHDLNRIDRILLEVSEPAYKHAWWEPKRPFTATAAQMHAAFVASVQIHDKQVLPAQFANDMLNRDAIWTLIDKTHCLHIKDFDAPDHPWRQRVTITFSDGVQVSQLTVKPKGVDPALTNDEIVDKWRSMARGIMPASKVQKIESLVLGMDGLDDATKLTKALNFTVKDPLGVGNEAESRTGRQVMANL